MKIFETERLIIRSLKKADKKYFAELFTDPRVLELIPQKAFTENQITERFDKSLNLNLNDLSNQKYACGIFEKGHAELIVSSVSGDRPRPGRPGKGKKT